MPPTRKRRREANIESDDDFEASDNDHAPKRTQTSTSASQNMQDTQTFVAELTKKIERAPKNENRSYLATFKAKVEKEQAELIAEIDMELERQVKELDTRRSAAAKLLACAKLPSNSASEEVYIPDYLKNTKQICEELGVLSKEGLASYHNVANFIAHQASNLSVDERWPEKLKQTQRLLKAGVKDTLAEIDSILGTDEDSIQDHTDITFDIEGTTTEDTESWRKFQALSSFDDEVTMVEDDYRVEETFDSMAAKLERQTRKYLRAIRCDT